MYNRPRGGAFPGTAAAGESLSLVTTNDYTTPPAGFTKDGATGNIYIASGAEGNSLTIGSLNGGDEPLIAYRYWDSLAGQWSTPVIKYAAAGYQIHTDTAAASNNTLTILSGKLKAYGGYAESKSAAATANGNRISILGGTIPEAYDGFATGTTAAANGNTITMDGGSAALLVGGNAMSTSADGNVEARGNTLVLNGGNIYNNGNSMIYGGDAYTTGQGTAAATGNIVRLAGTSITATFRYIRGGAASSAAAAVADDNQVILTNSAITGSTAGGVAEGATASASRNLVSLQGGSVSGDVFSAVLKTTAAATATDNVLEIRNNPSLSTARLWGYKQDGSGSITHSGNSLNIYTSGITAQNIHNFDNVNFYLPSTAVNGTTILTLTANEGTDLSSTAVKAGVTGNAKLQVGDTVTLIKKTAGTINTTGTTYSTLSEGVSLDYGLTIAADAANTNLIATITKIPASQLKEQTKSLVETRVGASAFLNSGADFLASQGLTQAGIAAGAPLSSSLGATNPSTTGSRDTTANTTAARTAAANTAGTSAAADSRKADTPNAAPAAAHAPAAPPARGFAPFAAMGGGSLRSHSGSYVDSRGYSLNLGFARAIKNVHGQLLFGPIIEYGSGHYDSYLDDGTHGSGDTHYTGAGFFARQENTSGLYYEGSLRAGRMSSDYASGDFTQAGTSVYEHYDVDSNYYAAHAGLGSVRSIGHGNTLDTYGKYFYSHQAAASADLATGETYHFSAVDSHRLRLGTRLSHALNPQNRIYAGLAWQYEFGGDARASYKGLETPSPSLKGASGMLELGWQTQPTADGPLTIDLALTGWTGKQEGITASAAFNWKC